MIDHIPIISRLDPGATPTRQPSGCPSSRGPAADFVQQLFEGLAEAGVRLGVLRGHHSFPLLKSGADLDLALPSDQKAGFLSCLLTTCRDAGVQLWRRQDYGHACQYHLAIPLEGGNTHHLALDVHTAETCYGVPYLGGHRLVASRTDRSTLPSAPADTRAVANFLGPFLSSGRVHPRYAPSLAVILAADDDAGRRARGLLRDLLGSRSGERLIAALLTHEPSTVEALARPTRRSLLTRRFLRRPLGSLLDAARFAWTVRVAPLLRPRGTCLAFVGTDGSGKSTLLEAVEEDLRPAFRGEEITRIKLRPGVLPQLDRIVHLGRSTYGPEDCRRPHRAQPSGPIGSALRATWYALDYLVGWPLRMAPLLRRHALVTLDRHYVDFLVDPERARIRRGSRIVRWLARSLPRPSATIVCLADPVRVHNRKPELTAEECARQMKAYSELAHTWPGCYPVFTDGSLEDSVAAVRRIALREVA